MKPHHAAAFALVGWYLMVPVKAPDESGGSAIASAVPDAASTFAVYQAEEQCETVRRQLLDDPVVGARMSAAKCLPDGKESAPQGKSSD